MVTPECATRILFDNDFSVHDYIMFNNGECLMMTGSFKFDGNFPYELKQDTRYFSDFFKRKLCLVDCYYIKYIRST